jgi:hypothetical protein
VLHSFPTRRSSDLLKGRGGLTRGRGVTESVRTTWVSTVHKSAAIHSALAELTDLQYIHEDMQNPELGKTRAKRDFNDLNKILEFLEMNNPFETSNSRLRSLVSGIAASDSDNINCDTAEDIGCQIVQKMDGVNFKDVVLKRAWQTRTLAQVTTSVTGGKKVLNIDPSLLFNRLLIIMERSGDMQPYFAYELSALPASLFKDAFMRKPDKSKLAKELIAGVVSSPPTPQSTVHVIDGGCLLHMVSWCDGGSYADVAQQYVAYVNRHYDTTAIVVFDGYCTGPATKDHEHQRRSSKCAPDVVFSATKIAYRSQAAFLANERNKGAFVKYLSDCFEAAGHTIHQAVDDADTLVAQNALQLASQLPKKPVTVIANDTDILILLIYHYKLEMSDIFMRTESSSRLTSIRSVYLALGQSVVKRLLVIHAVSGCDTTSSLYGHGKVTVLLLCYRSVVNLRLNDVK